MNPNYSLAYSRAGLGENTLVARRDLMVAVGVSLAVYAAAAWFGARGTHPAFVAPKPASLAQLFEIPPIADDEMAPVSGQDTHQNQPNIAPPLQPDLPSPVSHLFFPQPLEPVVIQDSSISHPKIVVPLGWGRGDGPGRMTDIVNVGDLDQAPKAIFQVRPIYPASQRHDGISGQVFVDFIVDANGNVRDAYAVRSHQDGFDASAVQAVMKWRFNPGKKAGRAVNVRMEVPINFSLDAN